MTSESVILITIFVLVFGAAFYLIRAVTREDKGKYNDGESGE